VESLASSDQLGILLDALPGQLARQPQRARDAISTVAIRTWCDAMGEQDSRFVGSHPGSNDVVAPPATLQMWTFPALAFDRPDLGPSVEGDTDTALRSRLASLGYTATLAATTDQEYLADLAPGSILTAVERYTTVSEEKRTSLGRGHFVTTLAEYTTQHGTVVGRVTTTVFHFRPSSDRAPEPPLPRSDPTPAERGQLTDLVAGAMLGPVRIPLTPTRVISGALATRDFYPVHHDRDFARAHGHRDILLNILTSNGLLSRVVGEWTGGMVLGRLCTRLRAPAYANDILTIEGRVVERQSGTARLEVVAATSLGTHAEVATTHDAREQR
jgi:acyl dehydratase